MWAGLYLGCHAAVSARPLLAKPDVLLLDHLQEVAAEGDGIARTLALDPELRARALLACALHDLGKATTAFQDYIRGQAARAFPHALAALPFVLVAERALPGPPESGLPALEATAAVIAHHSPLHPRLYLTVEGNPPWEPGLEALLDALRQLLAGFGIEGLPDGASWAARAWALLARASGPALLLAQELAHEGGRASLRGLLQQQDPRRFAAVMTVLHLADWRVSAFAERRRPFVLGADGRARVEAWLAGLPTLRCFQREAASAHDVPVLHLRAPTGTGKTEALLAYARDSRRILYLLPTQATANAMFARLRSMFGRDRVGLVHGRASWLLRREVEEERPEEAKDEVRDRLLFARVFAAPITVATLDQYLMGYLRGRHWEERTTLARAAAVLVDEIHAYEPYTLGLLLRAVADDPPRRLAFASATLPDPLLHHLPRGRLLEAEEPFWRRTRHHIGLHDASLVEEGAALAAELCRQGRSVLAVANTVAGARDLYRKLRALGLEDVHLLHARFVLRDRLQREKRVRQVRPGRCLVATQIVEVSLDISYDVLLTEIAPPDALVQRMGRVNRQGHSPPAPVHLFLRTDSAVAKVYRREVLDMSAGLLRDLPPHPTDRELVALTCRFYEVLTTRADWQRELEEGRRTPGEIAHILGCFTIDLTDEELRARFATRRGLLSVDVLPACFADEARTWVEAGARWRLVELLVPVPLGWWHAWPERFQRDSGLDVVVTDLRYDPDLGLLPASEAGEAVVEPAIW